jgi:GNAT superfamily N-acetyltransferase
MHADHPSFQDSTGLIPVAQGNLTRLSAVLQPYLPLSLPIIGSLVNHDSKTNGTPTLLAWTTYDVATNPPQLFAVFLFSLVANQCRFFCSAERSPGKPALHEEAFVANIIRSGIREATEVVHHKGAHMLPPSSRMEIGSVHEKWKSCLSTFALSVSPNVKLLRLPVPPINPVPLSMTMDDARLAWRLPENTFFSQLGDDDFDTVLATTPYARSRAYLRDRASKSISIRVAMDGGGSRPIAWNIIHADGSFGLLYVDPEFRRHKLAFICNEALTATLWEGAIRDGMSGWLWADVEAPNKASRGLGSAQGLVPGWMCHWMTFDMGEDLIISKL